jgi:hypothetical protein
MSLSSFERNLRQQQTDCLKLTDNNNNQSSNRRRATTVVHCLRHNPSSTITSIADHSLTLNTDILFTRRSISEEKIRLPIETLPLNTSDTRITTSVDNANINIRKDTTDSTAIIQNQLTGQQLPAYIIETC